MNAMCTADPRADAMCGVHLETVRLGTLCVPDPVHEASLVHTGCGMRVNLSPRSSTRDPMMGSYGLDMDCKLAL